MSDHNQYRNPHRINEPLLIFAWPAPQVLPSLMCLGMSMLLGHFYFFLAAAIGWFMIYKIISIRYPRGVIIHYLWWHGYTTGLTKETHSVPDPMKREYLQ